MLPSTPWRREFAHRSSHRGARGRAAVRLPRSTRGAANTPVSSMTTTAGEIPRVRVIVPRRSRTKLLEDAVEKERTVPDPETDEVIEAQRSEIRSAVFEGVPRRSTTPRDATPTLRPNPALQTAKQVNLPADRRPRAAMLFQRVTPRRAASDHRHRQLEGTRASPDTLPRARRGADYPQGEQVDGERYETTSASGVLHGGLGIHRRARVIVSRARTRA